MTRFNFTSLDTVFSYIPMPETEWDPGHVLELAYQAYETMTGKDNYAYTQRVTLIPIQNYQAKLPAGWRLIETVAYMFDQPTEEAVKGICSTLDEEGDGNPPSTDTEYTYNADQIERIQHQGIVNNYNLYTGLWSSDFYTNYFVLMRPMRTPHTTSYHCTYCPNLNSTCDYVYNIDPVTGVLSTNVENGWICVSYLSDPVDQFGKVQVIDHPDVFNAIAAYVMMKLWEARMSIKEESAYNLHMMYLDRWEKLAMKVRGMLNLHNMDHIAISNYQLRYEKLTKNYQVWNNQPGIIN